MFIKRHMDFSIEPPQFLFKYRNWSDCYHKKLITDLELFFASPMSFNDPFDFQITYRYDKLTREERKEIYKKELINLGYSGAELERQSDFLADNGPLADPKNIARAQAYQRDKMNNLFGVVSLSSIPDSILMWSHYASNHAGFCVGFNAKLFIEDLQSSVHSVIYEEFYPEIVPTAASSWLHNQARIMATKFKEWEYEKEYRLVKYGYSNKVAKLSEKYFKSLILGCAMLDDEKAEIINAANASLPSIEIFQAERHGTQYMISLNQIK